MTTISKVPVSKRAVEARVRRALAKDGMEMKRNRSAAYQNDLGDLYLVDSANNGVTATHCDLGKLAEELGVIKPHERPEL